MGDLTRNNVETLMDCAREIQAASGEQDFPLRMMLSVTKVIATDHCAFISANMKQGAMDYLSAPFDPWLMEVSEAFTHFAPQHPASRRQVLASGLVDPNTLPSVREKYLRDNAAGKVLKASQSQERDLFYSSPLYNEIYKGVQADHDLGFHLCQDDHSTVTLGLVRAKHDFTQHEMTMLEMLTSHIRRGYDNFRSLHVPHYNGLFPTGSTWLQVQHIISVSAEGKLGYESESARRLLAKYFTGRSARGPLPEEMRRWLTVQIKALADGKFLGTGLKDYKVNSRHGVLNIRIGPIAADGEAVLYLEECITNEKPAPGNPLTGRENEVLRWAAQGKTNGEIAIIMGLRPSTVKWHFENIYQKLDVSSRTAAVMAVNREKTTKS